MSTRQRVTDDSGTEVGEVFLSPVSVRWVGFHRETNQRVPGEYGTPEEATAALLAAAAEHAARLAKEAAMPAGARFALALRRQLHIGPTTHRRRGGVELNRRILETISEELSYPVGTPDGQAIRRGSTASYLYWKNILGARYSARLWTWLHDPTPYNLIGLLGDMIDQDLTTNGDCVEYFCRGTRWHRYADTRYESLPAGPLETRRQVALRPAARAGGTPHGTAPFIIRRRER